jgi:hypothetical protein
MSKYRSIKKDVNQRPQPLCGAVAKRVLPGRGAMFDPIAVGNGALYGRRKFFMC